MKKLGKTSYIEFWQAFAFAEPSFQGGRRKELPLARAALVGTLGFRS
jgi:hypothetical protein